MRFLRQSTASQEILLGPYVAAADGSAQTGLTIANTDIKLLKGGATSEVNKNSGGGTHIAGGRYSAVLDATDTDTVGILEVSVNPASGIPWNKSYYVFEEAIYDALFAASATGYLQPTTAGRTLDVSSTGAAGLDLNNIELPVGPIPSLGIIENGTLQSATASTAVLRSATSLGDDIINNSAVEITGGTGIGQVRFIVDWVSATDTATVNPNWTTTPDNTSTYIVRAAPPAPTNASYMPSVIADAGNVRSAVGLAGANLDTQLAKLDTIDDFLDTEVAAIKAKTDSLTFTQAGHVDANIQRINDVAITGNGQVGTEFNV